MRARLQEIAGRRVLVTGASGFLGSTLAALLRGLGAEVHGVSRAERATPEVARWWRADVAEPGEIRRVLEQIRPDVVFDLASHVSGSRELAAVPETLRANLLGAVHVLLAATELGVGRVVLAGSIEEPDPRETMPVPAFPYAAAKWAASAYARMFHALYGTPVVVARIAMAYGPLQRDPRKLVPHVVLSLLRGEPPRLTSGERVTDWTFGDDVAEGLVLAAVAPAAIGRTVDLGTGVATSVRDVALALAEIVGGGPAPIFGALPDRAREQHHLADAAATEALLGWRATTPLRRGLERTVAGWREQLARDAT